MSENWGNDPNIDLDTVFKGPFNDYVDKMRGEGVKKCLFLSTLRV